MMKLSPAESVLKRFLTTDIPASEALLRLPRGLRPWSHVHSNIQRMHTAARRHDLEAARELAEGFPSTLALLQHSGIALLYLNALASMANVLSLHREHRLLANHMGSLLTPETPPPLRLLHLYHQSTVGMMEGEGRDFSPLVNYVRSHFPPGTPRFASSRHLTLHIYAQIGTLALAEPLMRELEGTPGVQSAFLRLVDAEYNCHFAEAAVQRRRLAAMSSKLSANMRRNLGVIDASLAAKRQLVLGKPLPLKVPPALLHHFECLYLLRRNRPLELVRRVGSGREASAWGTRLSQLHLASAHLLLGNTAEAGRIYAHVPPADGTDLFLIGVRLALHEGRHRRAAQLYTSLREKAAREGKMSLLEFNTLFCHDLTPGDVGWLTASRAPYILAGLKDRVLPPIPNDTETLFAGPSPRARAMRRRMKELAGTHAPAVICGEPGTGTTEAALRVHGLSSRRSHRCLVVPCSGITEGLLEGELFGQSGMKDRLERRGLIDEVGQGTLVLEGVEHLHPKTRDTLFAAVARGTFRRVDDTRDHPIRCRVLATWRKDREECPSHFPEDRMHLSPLRDRRGDIPHLVNGFLKTGRRGGHEAVEVSPQLMALLKSHPWKGHVLELKEAVETILASNPPSAIYDLDHVPASLRSPLNIRGLQEPLPHPLPPHRRRECLLSMLRDRAGATPAELKARLKVSRQTLTKDLSLLLKTGRIKKIISSHAYEVA